jgi:hypothetical protein
MELFHLDLRAAIAVAAVEFFLPYLSITTVIILANLVGRRMV